MDGASAALTWLMSPDAPDLPTLADLLQRPAWMRDGSCLDEPSGVFFPRRGESTEPARAICGGCPVREECLQYALETPAFGYAMGGIWGGTSERERRRLRKGQVPAPIES